MKNKMIKRVNVLDVKVNEFKVNLDHADELIKWEVANIKETLNNYCELASKTIELGSRKHETINVYILRSVEILFTRFLKTLNTLSNAGASAKLHELSKKLTVLTDDQHKILNKIKTN